jgi:hypothetical protein
VGFRRSPDRIAAARNWQRFVENNSRVIGATGLPAAATASIENWDDFLMHGFLASDPGRFSVDQLTSQQYHSLAELVSNYFQAGYEFFTPMALSIEDQDALRARFADE